MTITKELECDYLIVGAGSSPLAFVDTLLTELPKSKVILIDKKGAPGGHWVHAYGFVRLHQPSIVYGISSKQLEGNWLKLMFAKFMLPWTHRASKQELLTYYDSFVDEKVASKQLQFYPHSVYDFDKKERTDNGIHYFSSVDGSVSYKVKVNSKFIDGTQGECIIPYDSPLQFPVDEGVRVMTPNQIYDAVQEKGDTKRALVKNKYVVLGAGKTGMDCIVYLQREMKIDPSNIAWVIANDVWMSNGGASGNPMEWPKVMAEHHNDINKASLAMEKQGKFVRLDETILPTQFRFPVIQPGDFKLLKKVKTIIRRGRATAIRRNYKSEVVVEFGGNHSPWDAFAPVENCVFVHATSPGPFNNKDTSQPIFESSKKMNLDLLFAPPVTFSMSCLAKIEAARVKGTLNTDAMRRLALALGEEKSEGRDFTDDDLLKILIQRANFDNVHYTTITLAMLFAIVDRDPMVPYKWMKENRLSLLSIPGAKAESCDDVRMLRSKGTKLGLTEKDARMLEILGKLIKPLEGM
jgi:hypothetical protein